MGDIHQWSTAAGAGYQFTQPPPNGAPEGMAASAVNNTMREMMAAAARLYGDQKGALVTSGTGSAYTLTTNVPYTALSQLPLMMFKVHADSVAGATLNVNGLGAKSILKGSVLLQDADLTANKLALVAYNSTSDAFDMLSFGLEPDSGRLRNIQVFASSGNYEKPAWLRHAVVEVVGGGGAGGGALATGVGQESGGSGGGGGGYSKKLLAASSIASPEVVTVGLGGVANAGAVGGNGGTSSFGTHASATGGGGGGIWGSPIGQSGVGGAGGGGGFGAGPPGGFNLTGGGGDSAHFTVAGVGLGGSGGCSAQGGGGPAQLTSSTAAGNAGGFVGGGGSGAANGAQQAAKAGGSGGRGHVLVWEYE